MRKYVIFLLFAALTLTTLQCTKSTEPTTPSTPPFTPADLTATDKQVISSSNSFGFKLFKEIAAVEELDSNIFISPLSASFALGMTYNGTALQTHDEMNSTLEYGSLTDQEINKAYQLVMDILPNLDPDVTFEIANGIWYRIGKPVKQSFIDLCQEYFYSPAEAVDFTLPETVDMINTWASEKTHGCIDTIVKPPLSDDLAMLLANAVYFKAAWTYLFDPEKTFTSQFQLQSGSSVACDLMYREDTLPFYANAIFAATDLTYGDGSFSMTVLVPHYGKTVDDILAELTAENWAMWLNNFADAGIPVYLPKFKFEYETGLNDMLKAMGMVRAFIPGQAEFYNMFDDSTGWIDTVYQKAYIQVDENGTEAAAVTVVDIYDGIADGIFADRPFLFVIHEHESGTILFMGKVGCPVWVE